MENIFTESFEKISMTATFVAYWRQYTDIPFAKDVAELINANEKIETFLSGHHITKDEIRWYAPLFEIRHKSIEEVIRRRDMRQVLELASGLSFRGLSMSQNQDIAYVETDLEGLTNEKRILVSTLKQKYSLATNDNFHLTTANALDVHQLESAIQHFHKDQPVAIVNEGLFPYLTASEIALVARNIRAILAQFGGIWITPDFSLKENYSRVSAQRIRVRDAIAELTGRQLHRNIFDNEKHLDSFLDKMGFHAEALHQTDLVSPVVSIGALHLPGDFLEKVRQKMNLWVIAPS